MIESISLKSVASYDPSGSTITDLKKVNFFFGFNGSGKSTIGRYLHNLTLDATQQNPDFGNCTNVGYDQTKHHILTFNDDFVAENFRGNNEIKGVFSLNQANAAIDQQIQQEYAKIRKWEAEVRRNESRKNVINAAKQTKYDNLIEHCWDKRAPFSTFSKVALAHSRSKANHLQEIKRVLLLPDKLVQSLEVLSSEYIQLYETEIKEVTVNVDARTYREIRKLEVEIGQLLQQVIVGNKDVDIAKLIDDLNARKWIEDGLVFLDKTGDQCPFCQKKTIDATFHNEIKEVFDETYKGKIAEIVRLKDLYQQETDNFLARILIIQNEFNPNNIVSNLHLALSEMFRHNRETIQLKLENSNERKTLSSIAERKTELSLVIAEIVENNRRFSSSSSDKSAFIESIWRFMAKKCKWRNDQFLTLEPKWIRIKALAEELKVRCESNIAASNLHIDALRLQTIDTNQAMISINGILKSAGFTSFEIAEKDKVNGVSRYYLKRSVLQSATGVFSTLSEGEKNFVAFLYFHQLCLGSDDLQSNGSKKKIIVIDDPVSSLDSQALFIVSSLVHSLILRKGDSPKTDKKLLKNNHINQVWVLTHNIYFYKEVSLDRRPICTDWWHYRITKVNNSTKIVGGYNKALFDDYELLWNSLKELKANIPVDNSLNVMIANGMRRIIESYVNFIGIGKDSWASLLNDDGTDPNYFVKSSFISTINDASHKVSIMDSVYYQSIVSQQPQVLFDVFEMIFKTIGKEHYEMMMGEAIPE